MSETKILSRWRKQGIDLEYDKGCIIQYDTCSIIQHQCLKVKKDAKQISQCIVQQVKYLQEKFKSINVYLYNIKCVEVMQSLEINRIMAILFSNFPQSKMIIQRASLQWVLLFTNINDTLNYNQKRELIILNQRNQIYDKKCLEVYNIVNKKFIEMKLNIIYCLGIDKRLTNVIGFSPSLFMIKKKKKNKSLVLSVQPSKILFIHYQTSIVQKLVWIYLHFIQPQPFCNQIYLEEISKLQLLHQKQQNKLLLEHFKQLASILISFFIMEYVADQQIQGQQKLNSFFIKQLLKPINKEDQQIIKMMEEYISQLRLGLQQEIIEQQKQNEKPKNEVKVEQKSQNKSRKNNKDKWSSQIDSQDIKEQ